MAGGIRREKKRERDRFKESIKQYLYIMFMQDVCRTHSGFYGGYYIPTCLAGEGREG